MPAYDDGFVAIMKGEVIELILGCRLALQALSGLHEAGFCAWLITLEHLLPKRSLSFIYSVHRILCTTHLAVEYQGKGTTLCSLLTLWMTTYCT